VSRFLSSVATSAGGLDTNLAFFLVVLPVLMLLYVGTAGAIAGFWQRVYRAFRGKPTYSELVDRVADLEDRIESLEQNLEARADSGE
jgi:hypothetical protein